jgi:hypothetical protein
MGFTSRGSKRTFVGCALPTPPKRLETVSKLDNRSVA